ncbi:uncharacterized protein CC84DRAFT_644322 [Paraphaeosphaeria sporulosa]|uniref:Uncharacterized protein n=1 Tax=Paraphaeosphaeria sporulosa TaxID=1460663 RepID=A0A177CK33_9PLEO|nr:uncharacterized protein CC84DRAFT_644322 [Paraphaeosphaeria sporulosa]OAG07209.1 hypothetical protein CC84DRAFT_644322 [Paraphaeosphaeria sporulosa]
MLTCQAEATASFSSVTGRKLPLKLPMPTCLTTMTRIRTSMPRSTGPTVPRRTLAKRRLGHKARKRPPNHLLPSRQKSQRSRLQPRRTRLCQRRLLVQVKSNQRNLYSLARVSCLDREALEHALYPPVVLVILASRWVGPGTASASGNIVHVMTLMRWVMDWMLSAFLGRGLGLIWQAYAGMDKAKSLTGSSYPKRGSLVHEI